MEREEFVNLLKKKVESGGVYLAEFLKNFDFGVRAEVEGNCFKSERESAVLAAQMEIAHYRAMVNVRESDIKDLKISQPTLTASAILKTDEGSNLHSKNILWEYISHSGKIYRATKKWYDDWEFEVVK